MPSPSPDQAKPSVQSTPDVDSTLQWVAGDDTTDAAHADADLAYSLDAQLAALEQNHTPPPPANAELASLQRVIGDLHSLAKILTTGTALRTPDGASTTTFIPPKIGKYDVVRQLGVGGQASAYLAFDPDLRRHVVLKLYRDAKSAEEQAAVLAEGQSLARVRSPFVAQVYHAERIDGMPYLVVEYVPGKNLADVLEAGKLPVDRALTIAAQLADGLTAVHACGLLHRDLKPSNVMVGDDGMPRLVDFGLATRFGDESLRRISGTLAYMAPEQARGESERIDPRSDVFGLGAVLYAMLTGRAPYQGDSRDALWKAAKDGEVTPPRRLVPAIPAAVEDVVMKALAKDPSQRFSSAGALRDAFQELQRRRTWLDAVSQRTRRHPVLFMLSGVAAAAVFLFLAVELLVPAMHRDKEQMLVQSTPPPKIEEFSAAKTTEIPFPLRMPPQHPAPPMASASFGESGSSVHPDGHSLRHDFRLEVEPVGGRKDDTGRLNLVENDVLTFRVVAERNCYVGLCYVDSDGMVVRLFPNQKETDHFIKAGTARLIPDPDKATLRATPSNGKEYVYFVASTQRWEPVTGKRVEGSAFAAFFSKEEKDRIDREFKTVRGLNLEFRPQKPDDKPPEVAEAVIPFFVEKK